MLGIERTICGVINKFVLVNLFAYRKLIQNNFYVAYRIAVNRKLNAV